MQTDKVKTAIIESIVAGNLDHAALTIKESNISKVLLNEVTEKAFNLLLKEKKYAFAISVCDMFHLPMEWKIGAVSSEFHSLMKAKDFEKAFEWGNEYGISKNDINSCKIKAFESAVIDLNIAKALFYIETFELDVELVAKSALEAFNRLYNEKKFLEAFLLAEKFDFSKKRTYTAAIKGFTELIFNDKIDKFVELESKYHIVTEQDINDVDEEDIYAFCDEFKPKVIKSLLDKSQSDKLHEICDLIDLLEGYKANKLVERLRLDLSTEAVEKHKSLMLEGSAPEAFRIIENFNLLKILTGKLRSEVISSAENSHNGFLGEANLSSAMFIKKNYDLYGKNMLENSLDNLLIVSEAFLTRCFETGQFEEATVFTKEYNIDKEKLSVILQSTVRDNTINGNLSTAIAIIKSFDLNIADKEVLGEASTRFHNAFEDGEMKIASDIATAFGLKEDRARRATVLYWKELIDREEYDKAFRFKKRYKISKRDLEPYLKEIHTFLMKQGRNEEASILRKKYRFNVSIIDLILEKIKQILKMN